MHTCVTCGVQLTKKPGPGRWPKRCVSCRPSGRPRPVTLCGHCGSEFQKRYGVAFCSDECQRKHYNRRPEVKERQRLRNASGYSPRCSVAFIVCRYCDTLFCARSTRSTVCYDLACKRRFNAERSSKYVHERRARMKGAGYERFDRLEIFERDKWTCGICELPVDQDARWPDAGSASLDHIVPLAKGGSHSRANTQCAHYHCNSVKHTRLLA